MGAYDLTSTVAYVGTAGSEAKVNEAANLPASSANATEIKTVNAGSGQVSDGVAQWSTKISSLLDDGNLVMKEENGKLLFLNQQSTKTIEVPASEKLPLLAFLKSIGFTDIGSTIRIKDGKAFEVVNSKNESASEKQLAVINLLFDVVSKKAAAAPVITTEQITKETKVTEAEQTKADVDKANEEVNKVQIASDGGGCIGAFMKIISIIASVVPALKEVVHVIDVIAKAVSGGNSDNSKTPSQSSETANTQTERTT